MIVVCRRKEREVNNVKLETFFLKAICEMKEGPSKSLFRRRLQTTISCCG